MPFIRRSDIYDYEVVNSKLGALAVTTDKVTKTGTWDFSTATSFLVPTATLDGQAVNKGQMDAAILVSSTGRSWKEPCQLATAGALPAYTRTASVLLANAVGALGNIDGVAGVVGMRILVKNGAADADNGIYVIDSIGGATKWQMTRAADQDASAESQSGITVEVRQGTANADRIFAMTSDATIVLNTTDMTWTEVTGLFGVTAGDGLQSTGNTMNVDVSDFAGNGLEDDGSENLRVKTDGSTLTVGAGGCKVSQYGITTNEIALAAGTIMSSDNAGHGSALALAAGQIPVGGAAVVGAGTIQNSGTAAVTGSTANDATAAITGSAALGGTGAVTGSTANDATAAVTGSTANDATAAITGSAALGGTGAVTGSTANDATAGVTGSTANDGTAAIAGTSATASIDTMALQTITNPLALSTTAVAAREEDNVAGKVWVGPFTNPDVPRCPTISFEAAWAGGDVTLAGTDWDDGAQTEVIPDTPGATVDATKPFKTITGATNENLGAGGLNHGATIGYADRLGLAKVPTLPLGICAVKGPGTTEAASWGARWVDPTTACNGAISFDLAYPFAKNHDHGVGSYAMPNHSHAAGTLAMPNHAHAAGTLAGPSHDHAAGTLAMPNHSHAAGTLAMPNHSHAAGTLAGPSHDHAAGTLAMPNHSHAAGTLAGPSHAHTVS